MNDAWIDDKGRLIEVSTHNRYASELLEKEMGFEELYEYLENNDIEYPYQLLHKRGWVRVKVYSAGRIQILGDCIDLTKQMRNTIDPAMNDRQLRVANQLCREVGMDFHNAINDRRFW